MAKEKVTYAYMPEFQCPVCKLKYNNRALAEACQAWCGSYDSCNFQIARQAINKDEMARSGLDDERFT